MAITNFYNEKGSITGTINEVGNTIQYYDIKHGFVGQYDKSIRKYHRWKTYNGNLTMPIDNRDYGEIDLAYWGSKH